MTSSSADARLAVRAKALGHPARIAILRALARQGGCSCCGDIVRDLPLAQSTVSEHLRILNEAGLIEGRIEGPRSKYWVVAEALEALGGAIGGLAAIDDDGACCPAPGEAAMEEARP